MDNNLSTLSYNISCDHITKLKEKYNNYNDAVFKQQFNCVDNNTDNNKNTRYLNNLYISKKTCIYTSTEQDELLWTKVFNDTSSPLGYKDDNARVKFNENTRRKII
jgi:hypothetical protein